AAANERRTATASSECLRLRRRIWVPRCAALDRARRSNTAGVMSALPPKADIRDRQPLLERRRPPNLWWPKLCFMRVVLQTTQPHNPHSRIAFGVLDLGQTHRPTRKDQR